MIRSKMRPALAAITLTILFSSIPTTTVLAAPHDPRAAESGAASPIERVSSWLHAIWTDLTDSILLALTSSETPPPPDHSSTDDDRSVLIDPDGVP